MGKPRMPFTSISPALSTQPGEKEGKEGSNSCLEKRVMEKTHPKVLTKGAGSSNAKAQ